MSRRGDKQLKVLANIDRVEHERESVLPREVKFSELKLGDHIRLHGPGSFMDAIVKKVEPDAVTVERPYMANADFSCGGPGPEGNSVICWIGHEDVTLRHGTVQLLRRGGPLK